jgi:hypothetical protein
MARTSDDETLDVRQWGADPGVADNAEAINACLQEAKRFDLRVQLDAMFPISDRIVVPGGVELVGTDGVDQCGIRATWCWQQHGPACVVLLTGRGSSLRNLRIEGAHDGTPTGGDGGKGVTGLIVQNADGFVVDQVVATHHSQMGMRVVGSRNGVLTKPTAEFCGRDGITLYGQGAMSDIDIVDAAVYQTGDDAIAVWDGAARLEPRVITGSIEDGSTELSVAPPELLQPGDAVVVDGAGPDGSPLAATVAAAGTTGSVVLSAASATTVDGASIVVGFRPPERIRIINPLIDQSPVHTTHRHRNGRGIVLGGAQNVTIRQAVIRNTVSIGLHLRHGTIAATGTSMWNRDITIDRVTVDNAGHQWHETDRSNGSVVLGRTVGLRATGLVTRTGAGHGLVLRDLVQSHIKGGVSAGHGRHGIVAVDQSVLNDVSVAGVDSSANSGDDVADTGRKLRFL